MSPCKLNNHRGLQHSNISLLFIISVLQFQPTPFLQCSFFEIRCPWYFRQSCLLTLHTGITHISGEISSVRMLHLSPFNETFNSDKWLPWSRRSRGVLGSKMLSSPSASKPPPGTSLVCVGSITRALASSPSLLLHCQQLGELLVSDRQLCHTRISFFGSKFICLVSALCCSSGRGK